MQVFFISLVVLIINFASCRDLYVGMFKKNDWLVAQDRLYKERVPYRYMYAKYGRIFKCKITYFRVSDRLGYGPGPKIQIVRGGLNHKYLVLRLTSAYNMPLSVNIYVGCANTFTTTTTTTKTTKVHTTEADEQDSTTKQTGNGEQDAVTTKLAESTGDAVKSTGGNETTVVTTGPATSV